MAEQPPLPDSMNWPEITTTWWDALKGLPGADDFTEMQWLYLMDTALLHASVWSGDFTKHGELGRRMAEFGVTPAAMARLNGAKPSTSRLGAPTEQRASGPAAAEDDGPVTPPSPIEQARARLKSVRAG